MLEIIPSFALFRGLYEFAQYAFLAGYGVRTAARALFPRSRHSRKYRAMEQGPSPWSMSAFADFVCNHPCLPVDGAFSCLSTLSHCE